MLSSGWGGPGDPGRGGRASQKERDSGPDRTKQKQTRRSRGFGL